MDTLTLTLSDEASKVVSQFAQDLSVTPDEAVTRMIKGFGHMFNTVIGAGSSQPTVEAEVTAVEEPTAPYALVSDIPHYAVTVDGVEITGGSSSELLINVLRHIGPKSIYVKLVANGSDDSVSAPVRMNDAGRKRAYRKFTVDGIDWYAFLPTGVMDVNRKIRRICKMMGREVDIID